MKLNPYQSPASDEADPRKKASLGSSLAFGAYAGAIAWATAGAVSMLIWGMCLAPIAGEPVVVVGVGGAFLGCFGGGVSGAIIGVAVAGLNWSDRDWPKQRTVFVVLSVAAGWLMLTVLGFVMLQRVWSDSVTFIPSFVEADQLPLLLVVVLVILAAAIGTPTGLWLGQRLDRFIHASAEPPSDA